MREKANGFGVDLLLIDTGTSILDNSSIHAPWLNIFGIGDLHDGAGLSDATNPNGLVSNIIFENIDYDLLTIGPIPFPPICVDYLTGSGNHELISADVAYETVNGFSKVYGERYLTSNVEILNKKTNQYEYIGRQYRYFTTRHGPLSSTFVALRS